MFKYLYLVLLLQCISGMYAMVKMEEASQSQDLYDTFYKHLACISDTCKLQQSCIKILSDTYSEFPDYFRGTSIAIIKIIQKSIKPKTEEQDIHHLLQELLQEQNIQGVDWQSTAKDIIELD